MNFETDELRKAIKKKFEKLAEQSDQKFHFHYGLTQALKLGYSDNELSWIPYKAIDSFAGVGNPLAIKKIERGSTVIDIGSGSGLDACLASDMVGPTGKVYGIDMTKKMVHSARTSADKMHAKNVTFIKAYAEGIPLPDASADVVISNGAINLSPDKYSVLKEIYRVLKPGGRIQMADIVVENPVPVYAKDIYHLWADCIAGAIEESEYAELLASVGFRNIIFTHRNTIFEGTAIQQAARQYGAVGVHILASKNAIKN